MKYLVLSALYFLMAPPAQEAKPKLAFYEGIIVAGYVNGGGFLNFTGPNIQVSYGHSKFLLGMMPSLRFKEDTGTPKNAFVTPSLGFGITYSYKALALQVPVYYNAKTATTDGSWHVGAGLGLRIAWFNHKKE